MPYFSQPEPLEFVRKVQAGKREGVWASEILLTAEGSWDGGPPHQVMEPAGKRSYLLTDVQVWPMDGAR